MSTTSTNAISLSFYTFGGQVAVDGMRIINKNLFRYAVFIYGDLRKSLAFILGKPSQIENYVNKRRIADYVHRQPYYSLSGFKYLIEAIERIEFFKSLYPDIPNCLINLIAGRVTSPHFSYELEVES